MGFFAEKEDLVELVILENGGTRRPSVDTAPVTSASTNTRRDPIERQKSFPKSYVASTHRSDWFEKMEVAGATATFATSDEVEDFVMVPSPDREAFIVEKLSLLSINTTLLTLFCTASLLQICCTWVHTLQCIVWRPISRRVNCLTCQNAS